MPKRKGRFYYRNEAEVMSMLGLEQVPGSGNGWVSKEDGESEHILCQLKSTDAQSISVKKLDIDKLILHALTSRKLPVFAIQFLQSDEVFLLVRPLDLTDVAEYLSTGRCSVAEPVVQTDDIEDSPEVRPHSVKSSASARERFNHEREKQFKKKVRRAT